MSENVQDIKESCKIHYIFIFIYFFVVISQQVVFFFAHSPIEWEIFYKHLFDP